LVCRSRGHTLSICTACDVVDLRVARGILAVLGAPADHLGNELLLCGLIGRECAEQSNQLAFAAGVGLCLALVEDIEQEDAEVAAGATLTCLQKGLCATEEDISCGDPVLGFGVARCDYAELLVGFIVLAFCDPKHVRKG
jgi:hypothetical protein